MGKSISFLDISLAKKLDFVLYDFEFLVIEVSRLATAQQLFNIVEPRPIPSNWLLFGKY